MAPLSQTELKVLRLMGNGFTQGEVATMLCRSPNTISTHVTRAIRKLGARHPLHAVILQLRQDLGAPPCR